MRRGWLAIAPLFLSGVALAADEPRIADFTEDESLPEAESLDDAAAVEAEPAAPLNEAAEAQPEGSALPEELTLEPIEAVAEIEPEIPELDVKKRVLPVYPDELQVIYGQQAIRCEALVWLDKAGKAQRISMVDCPDGFHLAALEAMGKWTWEKPAYAPSEGVLTRASTGFVRKDRRYFPGVTYFRSPERVTADPELTVTLKSGKMPRYPRQVNAGDDICLVELVVQRSGKTTNPVIDECAPPYRDELKKVVRSWKWTWREAPDQGETETVLAEVVFRL